MKIAVLSVTKHGATLGQKLKAYYEGFKDSDVSLVCYEKEGRQSDAADAVIFSSLKPLMPDLWTTYDRLLFIMATGITVRMIAPFVQHKSVDPAVVVMDEQAHFAISLLSGHLGGANEWTAEVAQVLGATPVITTATDVNGVPAPDVLARKLSCKVEDFTVLKEVNAALVAGETVPYYVDESLYFVKDYIDTAKAMGITLQPLAIKNSDDEVDLWTAQLATEGTETVETTASLSAEDLIDDKSRVLITDRTITVGPKTLVLRPPTMMVGVGCRRGTEAQLISQAIESALKTAGRSLKSVVGAASVIVKADEAGLLEAMKTLDWPIQFYEQDDMKAVIAAMNIEESNFVKETIGVGNVCETTALLRAKSQTLLLKKTLYPKTTVAIAQVQFK
ncbi:MAG: cobalt-precorrin 5A hydrolase [Veillonella sp.]|nr:cobalt-precorrin 5A hydrolase [Veillonella sp.]